MIEHESRVPAKAVLVTLTLLLVGAVAAASQTRPADADVHAVVSAAFERAVGFDPFDDDQLEAVRRREGAVRALPGFAETVAAGRRAVGDPTDRTLEREFGSRLGRLVETSDSEDWISVLYFVFKESVVGQTEDKKYWLSKLKDRNTLAETLAGYLRDLAEVSRTLSEGKDSGPLRVLAAHDLRPGLTAARVEPAASQQSRTAVEVPQTRLKMVPGRLGRVIEGEALAPTALASAGSIEVQPMQGFGGQWGGGAQLFWRAPAPVNEPIRNWPNLRLRFEVEVEQPYELTLLHTVAPDYGKFRVFLDGKIVADVDGWAPQVDVRERALGEQVLAVRSHEMILTVFDRNPSSQGWYVGVDALRLTAAGQSSPEVFKARPQLQEPPGAHKLQPQLRGPVGAPAAMAPVKPDERPIDLVVQIATPVTLTDSLTDEDRLSLSRVVVGLRRSDTERATDTWASLLRALRSRPGPPVDPQALIQWVLRESYLDQVEDLAHYADRVRFFNEQKRAIREHLAEARAVRADMPPDRRAELQTITVAAQYEKGQPPVRVGSIQVMSEEELKEYLEDLEQQMQTVGEDSQLANIELQDLMQKQQQTLQTLSNVSKLLHDTAMAVIRNLR